MQIRKAPCVLLTLLCLSSSVWAQTTQVPTLPLSRGTLRPTDLHIAGRRPFKITTLTLNGRRIMFFYDQAESDGVLFRLSGRVRFALDGTTIAADAADVNIRTGSIELRDNVSLKIK